VCVCDDVDVDGLLVVNHFKTQFELKLFKYPRTVLKRKERAGVTKYKNIYYYDTQSLSKNVNFTR
jgi:hypothetical protein